MRVADPARVQRILDSAAKLFAQRHYHEVRMDDIAAEAEVAKGTLYLHFKAKEDLYLALLLTGGSQLLKKLSEQMARQAPAEEKLSLFVSEVVRFFEAYPYFLELVQRIEGMLPRGQDSPLRTNRTRFLNLLASVIRDCLREKKESDLFQDADIAALALIGMIKEVLRFQRGPVPNWLPAWIVQQFLHGLYVKSGGRKLDRQEQRAH